MKHLYSSTRRIPASTMILGTRSTNGCWTCRLRRKKCDEAQPTCQTCASLFLTCQGYGTRPVWMDRGPLEREEAQKIKAAIARSGQRTRTRRTSVGRARPSSVLSASSSSSSSKPGPGPRGNKDGTGHGLTIVASDALYSAASSSNIREQHTEEDKTVTNDPEQTAPNPHTTPPGSNAQPVGVGILSSPSQSSFTSLSNGTTSHGTRLLNWPPPTPGTVEDLEGDFLMTFSGAFSPIDFQYDNTDILSDEIFSPECISPPIITDDFLCRPNTAGNPTLATTTKPLSLGLLNNSDATMSLDPDTANLSEGIVLGGLGFKTTTTTTRSRAGNKSDTFSKLELAPLAAGGQEGLFESSYPWGLPAMNPPHGSSCASCGGKQQHRNGDFGPRGMLVPEKALLLSHYIDVVLPAQFPFSGRGTGSGSGSSGTKWLQFMLYSSNHVLEIALIVSSVHSGTASSHHRDTESPAGDCGSTRDKELTEVAGILRKLPSPTATLALLDEEPRMAQSIAACTCLLQSIHLEVSTSHRFRFLNVRAIFNHRYAGANPKGLISRAQILLGGSHHWEASLKQAAPYMQLLIDVVTKDTGTGNPPNKTPAATMTNALPSRARDTIPQMHISAARALLSHFAWLDILATA
ncbi:hypothetical protein B0T19DRAFT_271576 [Cercophora scortea]|uniref:Zn(2)-C6 fungal-type domain-containing protein n=1 Tax=Cercophora scortea TaxID=314031 RepID=A0AAE0M547_9PEZI|nr:hypothetical protein B0T19DRAFT_271576 [Cercophora scortea]